MSKGSVFLNNRTQSVRIPAECRFPDEVKTVTIRKVGNSLVLTPAESTWDNFFHSDLSVTADFMEERGSQHQTDRDTF